MKKLFLTFFTLVASLVAQSQPTLVKDINTNLSFDLDGGKNFFIKSGNIAYFRRYDEMGSEFWRTDGTKEGTFRVTDSNAGYRSTVTVFTKWVEFDGELVFSSNTGEIWKADGTKNGTRRLTSTFAFENDLLFIDQMVKVDDNTAVILCHSLNQRHHLYKYSNDSETTTYIREMGQTLTGLNSVAGEHRAYFWFYAPYNGKTEVWTSDGTGAGTRQLQSLTQVSNMVEAGNMLVVSTSPTVILCVDVVADNVLTATTLPQGEYIRALKSTGAAALIATNERIARASAGGGVTTAIVGVNFIDLTIDDNTAYILGAEPNNDINLYYSDLTLDWQGALTALGNSSTYSEKGQVVASGDNIFATSWGVGLGAEPAVINNGSVVVVKDINEGDGPSNPQSYVELNGKIVFAAGESPNTLELWTTEGTGSTTKRVLDKFTRTSGSLDSRDIFTFNKQAWFMAFEGDNADDWGLWHSTTDGTNAVYDQVLGHLGLGFPIGELNGEFYAVGNHHLTKTDGKGNVTVIKKLGDLVGSLIYPPDVIHIGNKLIFPMSALVGTVNPVDPTGYELWVTDGTDGGTHILKDINPGPGYGLPYTQSRASTIVFNETTSFFSANDGTHGNELWKTDGTEAGTVMVKDMNPGAGSSYITDMIVFQNKMYFTMYTVFGHAKVWMTDGTEQGTVLLDFQSGIIDSGGLEIAGDNLLFTANNGGWSFYRIEGSAVYAAKQLELTGEGSRAPLTLGVVRGRMYFSYDDGLGQGRQLWVTDGSINGTKKVDSAPVSATGSLWPLTAADDQLYLVIDSKLYHIAGSKPEIEKLADMEPITLTKIDDRLYFKAISKDYGQELFTMPVVKFNQTMNFSVADRKVSDGDFALNATVNSGLGVVYSSNSSTITIIDHIVGAKSPGKVTITATQPGDGAFKPVTASTTFCISPARPQISLLSAEQNVLTSSASSGNQWFFNGNPIASATNSTYTITETGLYSVQVEIGECKSEMSVAVNLTFVGLEDKASKISLYPNPVDNTLFISEPAHLRIVDSSGRVVFNEQANDSVDVKSFVPGMYVAIVDNRRYVKFIKR